ncbi:transposase [Thiohalocapsa marina]|uniref:transposase n=1 Tax=Thiohalocapsa marina TaxID=424902 RepID=UPI0036DA1517
MPEQSVSGIAPTAPLAVERSLVQHFVGLDDPRCALQRRHRLGDMFVIAITAVLCGADGWVAIAAFGRAVRTHWTVENQPHWSLDVAFRDDDSRVREPSAQENLAVLRHLALSRLKNDDTKLGLQNKRLKAGWDEQYLAKLLFTPPAPEQTGQSINVLDN